MKWRKKRIEDRLRHVIAYTKGHLFTLLQWLTAQYNTTEIWSLQAAWHQSFQYILWHSRLWSFQDRDTKLERFLAKNQLYSNEIIKF